MPDGTIASTIPVEPRTSTRRSLRSCTNNQNSITSPTAMMNRAALLDQQHELEGNSPNGYGSYKGRTIRREMEALIDLAVTQEPSTPSDAIAVLVAAYSHVHDVSLNELSPVEADAKMEKSQLAMERSIYCLARHFGLTVQDFAGNYVFPTSEACE